jgi:hypothetical protein
MSEQCEQCTDGRTHSSAPRDYFKVLRNSNLDDFRYLLRGFRECDSDRLKCKAQVDYERKVRMTPY